MRFLLAQKRSILDSSRISWVELEMVRVLVLRMLRKAEDIVVVALRIGVID